MQHLPHRRIPKGIAAGERPVRAGENGGVARVPEVIGEKDKNQDTHAQPRGERNGQCDDEYALVSGEHLRRDKALIGAEEAAEHSDPDEQQQHRR